MTIVSERLEIWKAREKFREKFGPVAVFAGFMGLLMIVLSVVELLSIRGSGSEVIVSGRRLSPVLALFGGIVLCYLAVAFWNARAWMRWVLVVSFGASSVLGSIRLVEERSLDPELLLALSGTVYLLLPSTRRKFAQAEALRAWERSEGARFSLSRPPSRT